MEKAGEAEASRGKKRERVLYSLEDLLNLVNPGGVGGGANGETYQEGMQAWETTLKEAEAVR